MIVTIGQAFADWEDNTKIRFVQRHNEADFIEFVTGQDECSSPTGRIGGKQEVSLQTNCTTRSAIHEIGHALGMVHEHQRPDATVAPVKANIIPGEFDRNFKQYEASELVMCLPYERDSIMHYGPIVPTYKLAGME
jgi:Astacin (Peptidase family M12A)